MSDAASADLDALRGQADALRARLAAGATDAELAAARALLTALRNARQYDALAQLAEWLSRATPDDAHVRRLYAQALIEQGLLTAAIDVLQPLAARLAAGDPEQAEATGLLGRAFKQVFFDTQDKGGGLAHGALARAIGIYRGAWEADARNTWHGVNLVALLARGRQLGHRFDGLDARTVAAAVVQALEAVPAAARGPWHLPTLAEAQLGLGDWDAVERTLRAYVAAADAPPFLIASTLRQFTQVWDLEAGAPRGRALVDILRARLLRQGGEVELPTQALPGLAAREPAAGQLEAVLGPLGAKTFRWWKTGLQRAAAVAAIRAQSGARIGTGFLLRARALWPAAPLDEQVVLTNFHVVNPQGATPGIRPEHAEVVFEAVDANTGYAVAQLLWCSPPERHDAAVLRLAGALPPGLAPLPLAAALPELRPQARTYVVGHPGGRDLAFSFQDNELLDHEGPPQGRPAIDGVCRVHYRAPTEPGSSGSPVFNEDAWEVIALHHKGGRFGMPRLNGAAGTYGANEGIALASIAAAARW